jgi:hypothetical protein
MARFANDKLVQIIEGRKCPSTIFVGLYNTPAKSSHTQLAIKTYIKHNYSLSISSYMICHKKD